MNSQYLDRLARQGWYLCAAIAWGIFTLALPAYMIAGVEFLNGRLAAPETSLLAVSISIASFLIRASAGLFSLILATMLFRKRAEDRMTLFMAYFLLVYGVVVSGPLAFLEPLWPGISTFTLNVIQPILFEPFLVAFLCIFPNGHFVPDWTRWLILASALYAPVSPIFLKADALFGSTTISIIAVLLLFVFIFVGLYAQVYRYRHLSNPTERQQTKWITYGFTLALLFALISSLRNLVLMRLPSETVWTLGGLGWPLTIAVLPIALAFAVMRYRLYDIDIIINRTLVYGGLSLGIIAIYVLVVGTLGALFQAQGSVLFALLATGLIAVLFQPVREWLQKRVDHLVFGERDDPYAVLSKLSTRLQTTTTPEATLQSVVETIAETLKLPYVAIELADEQGSLGGAAIGKPLGDKLELPLRYQNETVGRLAVSPRSPGESFNQREQRLLADIAAQTGPMAYAVRLTAALQRSREKLVLTREEERRRIRRDLHDGLGPVLAGQGLKLSAARHLLRRSPEEASRLLNEVMQQNEATVDEVRRLVYELRPPALDDLGLAGVVEQEGRHLMGKVQLTVTAVPNPLPDLPAAVEVAAYRIVMEALTNIGRHANATCCQVCLEAGEDLLLEVVDDGVGYSAENKRGVGLTSMRERTAELGGEFSIATNPNGGMRIKVTIPCKLRGL